MAFFPTDTGGFFDGMNIFGAKQPDYLGGLLDPAAQEKLKNQALISGILGAGATYLAQPKNQGYGSALPYLAKSYLGGMTQSQNAYDQGTQNLITQARLSELKQKLEQDKLQKEYIDKFAVEHPEQGAFARAFPGSADVIGKSLFPTEKVEPIVKTFREGTKEVSKQWNPTSKTWDTLTTGEAFKPTTVADINPESITYGAEIYRKTGQMPAMGQGSSGIRQAILAEAARLNKDEGLSVSEGATNLVSNKATAGAITQLQKQFTMVGAFEKTASKNAELALQLSDKVDRTGVPIVNSWVQAGQKSITGNPDVSAFNAANETFVNEYAKIMSGSMGNTPVSDAQRAHAHEMLATVQTKEQYKAVMNVLRQEMANRMSSFSDELQLSKQGLSGNKQNVTPDNRNAIFQKYGVKP